METLLDGCYTVGDNRLYPFLAQLSDTENLLIEPSSCASFPGPSLVAADQATLSTKGLAGKMEQATHILWATGGSMVPKEEMNRYYERGKASYGK
jgi:D-serine dehydratase